jgi:hypothetical protein
VAEGGGACLFAIKKGVVITPSVTNDILESITRQTLIELLPRELNLPVEQRDIDRTELYVCDEAFFCGSGWEIVPISAIDGIPVGNGQAGPLVKRIHGLFHCDAGQPAGISELPPKLLYWERKVLRWRMASRHRKRGVEYGDPVRVHSRRLDLTIGRRRLLRYPILRRRVQELALNQQRIRAWNVNSQVGPPLDFVGSYDVTSALVPGAKR